MLAMTKAALLHALRRINLNDEVVFTADGEEHDIDYAFVVTGRKGLVLALTPYQAAAGIYADAETA